MKRTGEADALIPEFAARWRAKRKHPNKLYSTKYEKKKKKEENDLPAYVPKKHPNTYPRKIIQNTL